MERFEGWRLPRVGQLNRPRLERLRQTSLRLRGLGSVIREVRRHGSRPLTEPTLSIVRCRQTRLIAAPGWDYWAGLSGAAVRWPAQVGRKSGMHRTFDRTASS
mmetsp:Transcript_20492/g.36359  ORF Transcript_20492/g.36359 Transcript_20492/m.36359 type:complete len:103 (-) Transcript_20492:103-411(-)